MSHKPLAPVTTVGAAERAADHARARLIAARPNEGPKLQTLFAQPGLAAATETVARKVASRPLTDPGKRIPPEER